MKKLEVRLSLSPSEELVVGELAEVNNTTFFEFAPSFLEVGLPLSPLKLPLRPRLMEHRDREFGPLPGLFDDSLPDGWGLLLMDRHLRRIGRNPHAVTSLDRLAYLGTRTMGALTYHPPENTDVHAETIDLLALAKHAEQVMAGTADEVLPALLRAGGSPGGARPKVLVGLRKDQVISGEGVLPNGYEHWIVKFSAKHDGPQGGPIEYAYALMAKAAGISMPETRLLGLSRQERCFATKRFDRAAGNTRFHIHTFGNLIHANFRIPSCDYVDLLKAISLLTRNHQDVMQGFRQMLFNVAAHNRDDHAKNFSFIMSRDGLWALSPAYDLTLSAGPNGEHTMTILGEGRNPTREHFDRVATQFGLSPKQTKRILEEVNDAVSRWREWAEKAQCTKKTQDLVANQLRCL